MKNTVIYHSADFDGLFCREIARKFLPDSELIGWDFGDTPLPIPDEGNIYILDLPVDRVFNLSLAPYSDNAPLLRRIVWIDHHKSSIETPLMRKTNAAQKITPKPNLSVRNLLGFGKSNCGLRSNARIVGAIYKNPEP